MDAGAYVLWKKKRGQPPYLKAIFSVFVENIIHPELRDYISQSLKAILFHLKKGQLKKVFVCFENGEQVFEKVVLDVVSITNLSASDSFLVDLEQSLRSFLLKLYSSQTYLNELPGDATFSVQLETTKVSSVEFNQQPIFEVPKKKTGVNLKDEMLHLYCRWNVCNENFDNFDDFLRHLLGHSEELLDFFNCQWQDCPNPEIESQSMLVRHLSYHAYFKKLANIGDNIAKRNKLPDCVLTPSYLIEVSDNTCQWDDCDLWFGSITDFLYHVASHVLGVPSKSQKCDISCEWSGCSTKVSARCKLSEHMRVHTKERFIACSKCGAMFVTKMTFSEHRERQLKSNLRRYQCSQCLKLFPTERILSDHMRTHINQYKCTMCDMTSAKPSDLAKHYRYKHINDRPFKCHLCDKSFVANCNLKTHLLTHQDPQFKCEQCVKEFKSKVGFNNHMEKEHSKDSKPLLKYQCHVCKLYMARGDNLTKHLMKKHKFHWPSGHSRFRYRKDQDGICRLQTVRYESLEVTEEMIRSESTQNQKKPNTAVTYNITHDSALKDGFKVTVVEEGGEERSGEEVVHISSKSASSPNQNQEILITIEDLDDDGQVINCQVLRTALCVPWEEASKNEAKDKRRNTGKTSEKANENPRKNKDLAPILTEPEQNQKVDEMKSVKIKSEKLEKNEESESSFSEENNSLNCSNLSQGSVIALCDNENIQMPIEFVNIKSEIN